jgi:hypothetical protein
LISMPGESEGDFRIRVSQTHREGRDADLEKLRLKYGPKIAALQEKIHTAEMAVNREKSQTTTEGFQTAISVGATLLGALTGRKLLSRSNLSRVSSVARGVTRTVDQGTDVKRAQDTLQALQAQLNGLNSEFLAEQTAMGVGVSPANEVFESVSLKPKKTDISVQLITLVWAPYQSNAEGINQLFS